MVFTGTYEHTIDAKKRVAIPAEIRSQLQREAGVGEGELVSLYVMLGEEGSLSIYTEKAFEQRAAELDDSEMDADELLAYERLIFSLARRVELDKQGRVRLPENLLARTELETEVVILGVKDHLELRDRGQWMEHVENMLLNKPGLLMNPRRAMRKPRRDTSSEA